MIALDVSEDVMESAEKWGADLVLTHHPLMFRPVKCVDFGTVQGKIILRAALAKISIISAHTNFDKADKGLNDFFADLIGLSDIVNLYDEISDKKEKEIYPGIGRKGKLVSPMDLTSFAVHR
jgi:putative NIF3 family GTP cyclohydrolase 1 type 2